MSCFINGFSGLVGPSIYKESPKKSNTSLTIKINPYKDNNKKFDHPHFFKHKVDGHTTKHNKKKKIYPN